MTDIDVAPDGPATSDPTAIRALAHPTRLALLEALAGEEQATATRCAELTGQSVASCSFHLRTLAKHGFIAAVPGPGREKPWRLTSRTQRWGHDRSDPQQRAAAEAFERFFVGHEAERLQRWWDARRSAEPDDEAWYAASVLTGATAWLTLDQLVALEGELTEVLRRWFVDRTAGPLQTADDAVPPEPAPQRRPIRLFVGSSVGLPTPDGA